MGATRDPALALVIAVCSCGGEESLPPTPTSGPATVCVAPELGLPDGTCIRPGVAPDGCADGFVHDGAYGCEPVLPAEPCPKGLMAVPGDTACRPVMPCGEGKWGDIPVDDTTVYVDGSYAGADSDGGAERPWTTIADALVAAADGALIAVAAGSYEENVVLGFDSARLWGVCPERVEIVGSSIPGAICPPAAICVAEGATGSEVHGIALRGAGRGLVISGSESILADRIWVHDNAARGISAESTLGPTSVRLVASLVESSHSAGVMVLGSGASIESSVVRGTQPESDGTSGRGLSVQPLCLVIDGSLECDPNAPSKVDVVRSVFEQNHESGIFVAGSELNVDGTVVRTTKPRASDQEDGHGVQIQSCDAITGCARPVAAKATLTASLLEQNHTVGVFVSGSQASIADTVVRDTLPRERDKVAGDGVRVQVTCHGGPDGSPVCDASAGSTLTAERCLVVNNHSTGVALLGSTGSIDATVVSGTLPEAATGNFGRGIHVQPQCEILGADMSLCAASSASTLHVTRSWVDRTHDVGLAALGSDLTVADTLVRDVQPRASDAQFGDGVSIWSPGASFPASSTLSNTGITNSARAGVSSFAASVSLDEVRIDCAAFDLEGERYEGRDFVFQDLGGNLCGCSTADPPKSFGTCVAVSVGLAPPAPIDVVP